MTEFSKGDLIDVLMPLPTKDGKSDWRDAIVVGSLDIGYFVVSLDGAFHGVCFNEYMRMKNDQVLPPNYVKEKKAA